MAENARDEGDDSEIWRLRHFLHAIHRTEVTATDRAARLFGMTGAQGMAMILLLSSGESNCVRLAREMSYDNGAMSRLIDALDKNGWIERERSTTDRRRIVLRLTTSGRAIAENLYAAIASNWRTCLADCSIIEVRRAFACLQRLEKGFNRASL